MEIEITPEPTPEERAAIERALAGLRRERVESLWWRAGIADNTETAADDDPW